jgi:hypothetical protein
VFALDWLLNIPTDTTSTSEICTFAGGVTSDFEMFEELVDLYQGNAKRSDIVEAFLLYLPKHNLIYVS